MSSQQNGLNILRFVPEVGSEASVNIVAILAIAIMIITAPGWHITIGFGCLILSLRSINCVNDLCCAAVIEIDSLHTICSGALILSFHNFLHTTPSHTNHINNKVPGGQVRLSWNGLTALILSFNLELHTEHIMDLICLYGLVRPSPCWYVKIVWWWLMTEFSMNIEQKLRIGMIQHLLPIFKIYLGRTQHHCCQESVWTSNTMF